MNLLKMFYSSRVFNGCFWVMLMMVTGCAPGLNTTVSELMIHDLQGCGHTSPFAGQKVEGISGIVTFKDAKGFYLQSSVIDELFCTSEAIYVFTEDFPQVFPGDRVRVDGRVNEYLPGDKEDFNLTITEISEPRITIVSTQNPLPEPVFVEDVYDLIPRNTIEDDGFEQFDPKSDGIDFYESLESMMVGIRRGSVVDGVNEYEEIVVLPTLYETGNLISKSGALLTSDQDQNPEKIMVKLLGSSEDEIQVGAAIEEPIIGVLTYSFGNFKVNTFQNIVPANSFEEPTPFLARGQGITVATYNVENLSWEGADEKLNSIAIQVVDGLGIPDVIVLHEIMDDSGPLDDGTISAEKTLVHLVEKIEDAGGPRYVYVDNPPRNNQDGGIPGGNIRSVLLYRSDRNLKLEPPGTVVLGVEELSGELSMSTNPLRFGDFSDAFLGSRKPAVWLMRQNEDLFVILSLHLVSQGKNDPLWGSRQPILRPEENQRIAQAQIIGEFTRKFHALNPEIPILLAGDLNDLPWSSTLRILEDAGFVNLASIEENQERYSFIFDGDAQQLDYIMIDSCHLDNVIQGRFVHLNTHMTSRSQVSDHDPMVIEMDLR